MKLQEQGKQIQQLLKEMGVECFLQGCNENEIVQHFDFDLAELRNFSKIKKLTEILKMCLHQNLVQTESKTNHFALEIRKQVDALNYLDYKKLEQDNLYSALIGLDYNANPVYFDIKRSIHTLIGGATGMGKTSLLNNILYSLVNKNTKDTLNICLIDTKKTLTLWEGLPHLLYKPATDCCRAYDMLNKIIDIMDKRLDKIAKMKQTKANEGQFPYILVVIDELADLMLSGLKKRIEDKITKIAQLGRAVNISLLMATQNPIVKVCTSLIKANCPTRIALKTVSHTDSVNILGNKHAFLLDGVGNSIIRTADNPNELTYKVCYLDEEEIKKFLKGESKK